MVPLGVSSSLFTGELPFQVMTRAKGDKGSGQCVLVPPSQERTTNSNSIILKRDGITLHNITAHIASKYPYRFCSLFKNSFF